MEAQNTKKRQQGKNGAYFFHFPLLGIFSKLCQHYFFNSCFVLYPVVFKQHEGYTIG
ncbi:Hypothetical protein Minf_1784 [Methylacidiphilum infernorum V4]|uniref:Uncharacterized protein n=1 Tax=Methylacidiphilum infernorum (isolate V4) TaxID=481448 RepID=B3DXC9_METI4|nr:Hypothetical protein Minf_1784 [Methylacidiphilum infernorum V4]